MEQSNENSQYVSKKQYFLSVLFVLVIIFTLFLSLYLLISNKIDEINVKNNNIYIPTFEENKNDIEIGETKYLLKKFNDILAVYKNNDLQYTIDIKIDTLPENDKKLLSKGIEASSEKELNDIISSYY